MLEQTTLIPQNPIQLASTRSTREHASLKDKFGYFNNVQNTVIPPILKEDPRIISTKDPATYATELVKNQSFSQWTETAKGLVQQYVELEKDITKFEGQLIENNQNIRDTLCNSLGIQNPNNVREVRRIHGGYAIVLSLEEMRNYLKLTCVIDGEASEDSEKVLQAMTLQKELGFLLDPDEIKKAAGLPPGIHIALIADTGCGPDQIASAIQHEEREEIGQRFDHVLKEDKFVRLLDRLTPNTNLPPTFDRKLLQRVGYDLAAHVTQGHSLNLATVGITRQDAQEKPAEVLLIKTLLAKIAEMQQVGIDPQEIANCIRGGTMRVENLLVNLLGPEKAQQVMDQLKSPDVSLSSEDIKGIVFKTQKDNGGKEGRFIFTKKTLTVGETIILQGVKYKISADLGQGGMGATYKAIDPHGGIVVIKEMLSSNLPSLLLDTPQSAGIFFDGLLKQYGTKADPFVVLQNFAQFMTCDSDLNAQFNNSLDSYFKNSAYPDFYNQYQKGLFGSKIVNPSQCIDEIRKAIVEFYTTASTGNTHLKNKLDTLKNDTNVSIAQFQNEYNVLLALQKAVSRKSDRQCAPFIFGIAIDPIQSSDPRYFQKYMNIYLIMELIEGKSLTKEFGLDSPGTKIPNVARAIDLGIKLCESASIMHSTMRPDLSNPTLPDTPVVHRDIKGDNVFIRQSDGRIIYIDLGIAKKPGRAGTIMAGTGGHIPPYVFVQGSHSEPSYDIYQNTTLLFQLFTGVTSDQIQNQIDQFGYKSLNNYIDQTFTKLNITHLKAPDFNIDPASQAKILAALKKIIQRGMSINILAQYPTDLDMQKDLIDVYNMLDKNRKIPYPQAVSPTPVAPPQPPPPLIPTQPLPPPAQTIPLPIVPLNPSPTKPLYPPPQPTIQRPSPPTPPPPGRRVPPDNKYRK